MSACTRTTSSSHTDSDRGRILRLGCPQSYVFEGALRTPWRMRDKTAGAGGGRLGPNTLRASVAFGLLAA